MSSSKDKDPASIHPGLKSLDYLNPKLGDMYLRYEEGEELRYSTSEAFLLWKAFPSTQAATKNRPFFIFLHDYGSSSRIWNKVVSEIKHYCVAVDLLGWGRSDDTKDDKKRAYSITNMKNQITRIVNLLKGENFMLVGHGMGAKVAQLYAAQDPPDSLVGLALLSPAPLSSWRPAAQIMEEYKAAYKPGGDVEKFVLETLAHRPIHEDDLRKLVEDGTKDTPLAKDAWLTYGMGDNHSHALKRIEVPTMVRFGDRDRIIQKKDVDREVGSKIEVALKFTVSGCGHLLPLEDPDLAKVLGIFGEIAENLKLGKNCSVTFELGNANQLYK